MMTQALSPENVPQYNGKSVAYSLEPLILARKEASYIEASLSRLLKQVEDFTDQSLRDKGLLKKLGLPADLDPRPTPLGLHIPFARFDFLFNGSELSVLELNTDGTSAFNVAEWVNNKAGIPDEENPNLDLCGRLLGAIREHKPKAKETVLLDFPNQKTSWEQENLINQWWRGSGVKFADPMLRSWSPGALIYRRAVSWQLRAHPELAGSFLQDWKEEKIEVIGGWSSDVGMSKVWLTMLNSPLLPETILLEEKTSERLKDERESWMIKAAFGSAGNAVISGKEVRPEKWPGCVDQKAQETKGGRPWIAQRLLPLPVRNGKTFELGLYFLNGKPSGYLCRAGHSGILSDSSEEVMVPVQVK